MSFSEKIKSTLCHPNFWTLFRIVAVPGIVMLLLFPKSRVCTFSAALLFSAAAISDYLDGYFARKLGLITNFGKAMDPLADKLLVSCSLIMMTSHGWIYAWIVCIIIGREIAVTALRGMIAEEGKDVSASWLGKYKTGFQIAAIIPLLIHFSYFGINFHAIGYFYLWGALILTIWSGTDYFFRFRKLFQVW
jgi:CDP-diacylglycerol--glycerol-3-phosphate 3-phosphatidyltransferase